MPRILTINSGSSSIKLAVYDAGDPPKRLLTAIIDRIGLPDAELTIGQGAQKTKHPITAKDHAAAMTEAATHLSRDAAFVGIAAIGHRIVHGGPRLSAPVPVTPAVMDELRSALPLAPEHLPAAIALIEGCTQHYPGLPQVLCFDTAFHHDMPRVAQQIALPRRFEKLGVRRYGFHGLSYEFLMSELQRLDPKATRGRIVLAHLGRGCSMAAVREGRCIDTSMGFTPAAGLVMGTRAGDIDPGLVRFVQTTQKLTPDQFDRLVNKESGMLGVSETSPDMRDLLEKEPSDPRAAEAVALFCYHAKKWIGAYAAALGGLDTLVFAGGIGENSPVVRERICAGMEHLGITLDARRNAVGEGVISGDASRVVVRLIRTDEEIVIARAVMRLVPD